MVTAATRETETTAVVSAPVVEPVAAAPAAPVNVAAIPETPAELLKQWDTPRNPSTPTGLAAKLARVWDSITGPGMTDLQRLNRDIAEHNGWVWVRSPHV